MKKLSLVFLAGFLSLFLIIPAFATRFDHGMPGIYNATLFTLGDGEGSGLSTDINGRILLSPSSTISASFPASSTISVTFPATSTINAVLATSTTIVATSFTPTSTTQTFIYNSGAGEQNIKASSGRLHGFFASNRSASTQLYIQFFNTSTIPTTGATPLLTFALNGGNQMIVDASYFQYLQKYFSNGIAIGISSTFGTYTPTVDFSFIDLMGEYD